MTTKYQSPIGHGEQFCDDNGDPLAAGTINTYVAGTTTNKATYKDNAGAASHANPIVLDSDGRVPSDALWIDNDQDYKYLLKTAAGVTIWTIDNIASIQPPATSTTGEWVTGPTPTYIGATQFSLTGDQTSTFNIGRRVRTVDGSNTLYGTITASAFSSVTTITVDVDGGTSIASDLASVAYSIISGDNTSSPALENRHLVEQGTSPATPAAGFGVLYPFASDKLATKLAATDAGTTLGLLDEVPYLHRLGAGSMKVADAALDMSAYLLPEIPQTLVMTPTADRIITLPSTGVPIGFTVGILNLDSTYKLTVLSSNDTTKLSFINGYVLLMATANAPTGAAQWKIIQNWGGARPMFRAYLSGNQASITGTDQIEFDTAAFDNNGNFNTSLFRWLPTVPGRYHLEFILQWAGAGIDAGDLLSGHLYKDGSAENTSVLGVQGTTSENTGLSGVSESDGTNYFEVFGSNALRDDSLIQSDADNTFFCGHWIGE